MVTVIQDPNKRLYDSIGSLSEALGGLYGGYQKKQEEKGKQEKFKKFVNEKLFSLGPNPSPQEVAQLISQGIAEGIPAENFKPFQDILKPQLEQSAKSKSTQDVLNYLGLGGESSNQEMGIKAPSQPSVPNTPQGQGLQNLSDDQLVFMQSVNDPNIRNIGKAEQDRRKNQRQEFRQDRDFAYKRNQDFFKKLEEDTDRISEQTSALALMQDAVETGDLEFWSRDNFAKFLGKYGEALRTTKGSQLLTAQKEFLVSDIGRIGNRPNQWIEMQISDALTRIGRDKEANLTVIEALKARNERDQAKQRIARDLEQYYLNKDGTIPSNFSTLVRERMAPIEQKIQDKLAYRTRSLYEKEQERKNNFNEITNKKPPKGTPATLRMLAAFNEKYKGNVKQAKQNIEKLGYKVLSTEEYQEYDPENYTLIFGED